jgi:iron(III) transport system substrate-binding protein
MKLLRNAVLGCELLIGLCLSSAHAAEGKPPWEAQWQKVIEGARKEAQLAISHTRGPFEKLFAEFNKRHPEIKVTSTSGRGGDLISRIMAERRAGKYLTDIYLGSSGTPLDVLYPAKALEAIQPFMILPEVGEPAGWFRGRHHYADPENRFIYVFEGVVRSDMAYNTALVDAKEFSSYWDLLNPRWKGKIAAMDPKLPGFPSGLLQFSYYHPELGARFLRRLFGEMDITLSRDGRQLVDWLSVGKFAIALAPSASEVQSGMKQGLPLARFEPRAFKEGIYMRATQGSLSILTQLPHPHAAKLFVNWLLSREGQIQYQKHFTRIDPIFSLREDVPVDAALDVYKPDPGDKFMPIYRAEYRALDAAFKIINEVLKR